MAKQTIVIQLIVDSRMIWQVKQDVPRENCRRMNQEELTRLGIATSNELGDIVRESSGYREEAPARSEPRKKR